MRPAMFALIQYSLHQGGLEPDPQYLHGTPVRSGQVKYRLGILLHPY